MRITIENLAYTYYEQSGETIDALKQVTCTIDSGDFVGIVGKTGCGKTTLIQLIAGLLTPTEGHIYLDDEDINDRGFDRNILRQSIGVVFQYPEYQLFETTVEKDVAFGLKHSDLNPREKDRCIKWALETMGFQFENIRKKSPLSLSGGEKRRVAIAGIIAVKPKILIFDEPIAGLDPYGRQNFLELVTKLNNSGTTIIMISHNTDAIAEYSQHMLILEDGRLIQSGETSAVFLESHNKILRTGPQQVASLISEHKNSFSYDVVTYNDLIKALRNYLKGGDSS